MANYLNNNDDFITRNSTFFPYQKDFLLDTITNLFRQDYEKQKKVKAEEERNNNLSEQAKEAYKQLLYNVGANIAGSGADVATSYLSNGMVFGENTQKFSEISKFADNIPVFGNAVKFARMGINAGARALSEDIDTFDFDPTVAARMGAAYDFSNFEKLKETNGKKALMWKVDDYNEERKIAKQQFNTIANIDNNNQARLAMANNVGQNLLNYNAKINGGSGISYIGRKGLKFDLVKRAKRIKPKKKTKEFKEGGIIFPEIIDIRPIILERPIIKKFQGGGKTTRSLEELITYAKEQNPRFVQRLSESPRGIKFTDDEGNEGEGSHYLEWSTDETGNAIIYPRIQEMEDGSLKFLSTEDAYKRAMDNKNILKMSQEEANIFFAEDPEYFTAYKRGWPEFFKKFQKGGSIKESEELIELEETNLKNVIPEGALHKNKHHIEHSDGLTLKGIPVIDENGEQQAEIELDEIIFTLEVTKKLEELHKIFKEGNQKEKDKAAIEAGKLLVLEILYNTDDRTGLISKCLKGGKLNELE